MEPPDIRHFQENRNRFPPDRLQPYYGKHVAWSPDGTRILAAGRTEEELEKALETAGIPPSQVVGEFIPPADLVIL
jgi:hypothetical protein